MAEKDIEHKDHELRFYVDYLREKNYVDIICADCQILIGSIKTKKILRKIKSNN